MGPSTIRRELQFVVLLKLDTFEIVECSSETMFPLAKERNAGICGVFPDRKQAEEYIARARSNTRRNVFM